MPIPESDQEPIPHLVFTHEVCVVFVMLQRVVQRKPLRFLLVHCILLEKKSRGPKMTGETRNTVPSSDQWQQHKE